MNKVNLTGRITKDPELKLTPNGTQVVAFTLAVNRDYKDANGEKQCDFLNCVAWRAQANFIANYIRKGYMLGVCGTIQNRQYTTQNNETRIVTEIMVDSVENLTPAERPVQTRPAAYNPDYKPEQRPAAYNPEQRPGNTYQAPYDEPIQFEVKDDDIPF